MRRLPLPALNRLPAWALITGGALLWVALMAAAIVPKTLNDRRAAIADAREWTINGPPCPTLTEAAYKTWPYRTRRGFAYSDTEFGLMAGDVSCAQLRYDGGRGMFGGYPVCQFTSPAILTVKTEKGLFIFPIGVGRQATVSAPHGEARCVLAGTYRAERLGLRH